MLFSTLTSILLFFNSFCINEIVFNTKYGQIRGKSSIILNKTIYSFLGIRYGQPPVGQLRFKKPLPITKWDGIYDAMKNGHSCWQKTTIKSQLDMDEDCLFLNIWTPLKQPINNLIPVMFWIHGGRFVKGSSSSNLYNGKALAAHDMVIVSINYRLGPFGFLYGGTDEAPGNAGFWDMELALNWVKDNIHEFGGDSNKITLFGQSSGGNSVGHLLTSPITNRLFNRAILQSGAPYYYNGNHSFDKQNNLKSAKEFGRDLCCDDNENWLNCLKSKDPKKIVKYNAIRLIDSPIIGDEFMPMSAQETLKHGKFNNTQILIGINANEGTMYSKNYWPKIFFKNINVTKDELFELLDNYDQWYNKPIRYSGFDQSKVYDYYLNNQTESDQNKLIQRFSQIFGDYHINCPSYFFAKDFALISDENHVYYYILKFKSIKSPIGCTSSMGICHTEDLPFVFGMPIQYPLFYSDDDYRRSLLIMNIWTSFAKTGVPLANGYSNGTIDFPIYKIQSKGKLISIIPEQKLIEENEFVENCDKFWKSYFN